jgi:hypothetical protein
MALWQEFQLQDKNSFPSYDNLPLMAERRRTNDEHMLSMMYSEDPKSVTIRGGPEIEFKCTYDLIVIIMVRIPSTFFFPRSCLQNSSNSDTMAWTRKTCKLTVTLAVK